METIKKFWETFFERDRAAHSWWERKQQLCEKRNVDIIRIRGDIHMYREFTYNDNVDYEYLLHLKFLMKQEGHLYLEEQVVPYVAKLDVDRKWIHEHMLPENRLEKVSQKIDMMHQGKRLSGNKREGRVYDRHKAVQYAERWWNSYNPEFRKFDVDCTNYVSQCLFAGGAPMHGAPQRDRGWWYQHDTWSYSWAVAHSMRWYLNGSTIGLKGREVENPEDLLPGDVICYDFQGDGRWDHNTIVVTKDAQNMPLVNAHTDNSRHRYWSYEDSTAWTPNIKYKFFQIEIE